MADELNRRDFLKAAAIVRSDSSRPKPESDRSPPHCPVPLLSSGISELEVPWRTNSIGGIFSRRPRSSDLIRPAQSLNLTALHPIARYRCYHRVYRNWRSHGGRTQSA